MSNDQIKRYTTFGIQRELILPVMVMSIFSVAIPVLNILRFMLQR